MDVNIAMKLLSQKILLTIKENYIEAINKLSKESFDVYGFINDEFTILCSTCTRKNL